MLKRVPKDSGVLLAESLADKINENFYMGENVTYWLVF